MRYDVANTLGAEGGGSLDDPVGMAFGRFPTPSPNGRPPNFLPRAPTILLSRHFLLHDISHCKCDESLGGCLACACATIMARLQESENDARSTMPMTIGKWQRPGRKS
jgi:hypothetical protein